MIEIKERELNYLEEIKQSDLDELMKNIQSLMNVYKAGKFKGAIIEESTLKTTNSGARVEINPDSDKNIGLVAYDDNENELFKIVTAGADVGDVIIGDYAGGQGIKYDKSAGTLDIQGGVSVDELHIPDKVTDESFHVDTEGNTWWGATAIGSAVASVTKTGVATFTNVKITGLAAGSELNGQYITDNTITALKINVSDLSAISADLGTITAGTITLDSSGYIKGGQTAYDTGIGFFLGYSTDAYKFSIGNASGQKLLWDGSNLIVTGGVNFGPGNILLAEANTERSAGASGDNWPNDKYLVKQITINNGGMLRISFDLKCSNDTQGVVAYARVYRGTTPVGTERSRTAATYQTFTEDITGWNPGDQVRLYIGIDYAGAGAQAVIRNFKIKVHGLPTATVDTD